MNKSKAKSLIVASANFQLLKKNAEEALSIVDKQMAIKEFIIGGFILFIGTSTLL